VRAGTLRVLLVDDLAEIGPGRRIVAGRGACRVEEVGDHVSFFRALRENRYDIVITEQDLHWSSGQEVLLAVKSLGRRSR
jgi:DNA-binding NtrC family response regulator